MVGGERGGSRGRRMSRWLGTCRTQGVSCSLFYSADCTVSITLVFTCFPSAAPFFFSLLPTHTHTTKAKLYLTSLPLELFTCSLRTHTHTHAHSHRQCVTRRQGTVECSTVVAHSTSTQAGLLSSFMSLSTSSSFLFIHLSTLHLVA